MSALLALLPFGLALWRPTYALGLLAAALPTYLVRYSVAGIPTTLFELGLYATALGVAIRLLRERQFGEHIRQAWRSWGQLRWPTLALLAAAALATALSLDQRAALGAFKAWFFDAALAAFLIVMYRRRVFWSFVFGLATGTGALSLWGLAEYMFRHATLENGRLNSVFGTPNYHAMLIVPVTVLLLAAALRKPKHWPWLCAAIGANVAALAFTFSYGGYLSLAVGGLVVGLMGGRTIRRLTVVGVIVAGLLFISTQATTDKFRRLKDLSQRSSTSVRLQIWRTSLLVAREHPWLGVGPNAFEKSYRETVPRVVFPPLEWLVAQPHSFPLAVATQMGAVGIVAFVWLFVAFFQAARRRSDWLRVGLTATMVAVLVHGLVDTPFFKNDLAVLVLGLMAVTFASEDDSDPGPEVH